MVRRRGGNHFAEKGFYLQEFRDQTLVIVVPGEAMARLRDARALVGAVSDLLRGGTRVALVWGMTGRRASSHSLSSVPRRILATAGASGDARVLDAPGGGRRISVAFLRRLWTALKADGLVVARVDSGAPMLADFAQRLGVRLGVRKIVLVDSEGGIANEAGLVSFMDGSMLEELLRRGEAEWVGVGHRRGLLESVHAALRGGVDSVNVCGVDGVARELFTYEGVGTLFTLQDYCRVERLRVDRFPEVERLLERGEREGYLRPRNARQVAEILMNGYGATMGSGHIAGICALDTERYRGARAGEIVGLYTITRFKAEGIGTKLIARALDDARRLGLRYVFACSTHSRPAAFFERNGFRRVPAGDVPEKKWRLYPAQRRGELAIFKVAL